MTHPRRGDFLRGTSILAALVFVAVLSTVAFAVHAIAPNDPMAQTASARLAYLSVEEAEAQQKAAPVASTAENIKLDSKLTGPDRCNSPIEEKKKQQIESGGSANSADLSNICVPGCSFYIMEEGASTIVDSDDLCEKLPANTAANKPECQKIAKCSVYTCGPNRTKCKEVGSNGLAINQSERNLLLAKKSLIPSALTNEKQIQDALSLAKTNPDEAKRIVSEMNPYLIAAYKEASAKSQLELQADIEAKEKLIAQNNAMTGANAVRARFENETLEKERQVQIEQKRNLVTLNADLASTASLQPRTRDPGETGGSPEVFRPAPGQANSTFNVPPEYNPDVKFSPEERKSLENPVPKVDGGWTDSSRADANKNLGPLPPRNPTDAERAEAQKKYPNLNWDPKPGRGDSGPGPTGRSVDTGDSERAAREAQAARDAQLRTQLQQDQAAARRNDDLMKLAMQGFMLGFSGAMRSNPQSPYGPYGQGEYGSGQPPIGNSVPQPPGTCGASLYCQNNLQYQRNTNCVDQVVQQCQYGCAGNQCAASPLSQCPPPPPQPPAAACTGSWQQQTTQGPSGQQCVTGWTCTAAASTDPSAEIACAPLVADAGMNVAISYSCGNSTTSTGTNFATAGALSGTTTATTPTTGTSVTYAISCRNAQNQSKSASCTVQIAKPSIVLVVRPQAVPAGETATIGWVTSGMRSCVVSSPQSAAFTAENADNTAVSGSAKTPALTASMSIVLNCETVGGNARTASTTVAVQ